MPNCFIIMPVTTPAELIEVYGGDANHFAHVLTHLFSPAIEQTGYTPIPPVAAGADLIQAEIIRQLESSDLVLCDMSSLNPNVFFELGIRTAVDKPLCLVKDDLTMSVPFDTGVINFHTYHHSLAPWVLPDEIQRLSDHLLATINRSDGRNNLWRYFGLTTRASFDVGLAGESSLEEKVDLILLQLEGGRALESGRRSRSNYPGEKASVETLRKWVIEQAQSIAAEVNAVLTVREEEGRNIVVDANGYALGTFHPERINLLGQDHGFKITILQSGKERPHESGPSLEAEGEGKK